MTEQNKAQTVPARSIDDAPAKTAAPRGLDVDALFSYHAPVGDQPSRYAQIRSEAHKFALLILATTPPGPEQTLAIRDLQRCVMMANAAIAIGEAGR